MKKTGLIIGSIEIILGLLSLIMISVIKEVMPKIARMCFMFNSGSFSESTYELNFTIANTVSIILCVLGIATIGYFVNKEQ